MKVTIENRSDQQVLLRFTSGATRALAPHEIAKGVENVEVKGNRRIAHLVERGLITVAIPVEKPSKRPARKRPTRKAASPPTGRRAGTSASRPQPASSPSASAPAKAPTAPTVKST